MPELGMGGYRPDPQSKAILDAAWSHIAGVSYQVSVRWVFYRLLQDGLLSGKQDYKKAVALLSKARKRFYGGWNPQTLADEGRAGGRWNRLAVDHDHRTGAVRGLLCHRCNQALGQAKDDPNIFDRMADYLRHPQAKTWTKPRA